MCPFANSNRERISTFLEKFKKMEDPAAVIFAPKILSATVKNLLKKVFDKQKISVVPPGVTEREQIDKSFRFSLKEGSLLLINYDTFSDKAVKQYVQQILEEGYITMGVGSNWIKVEPVEGWRMVMLVNRDGVTEDEFPLSNLFTNKLAVES